MKTGVVSISIALTICAWVPAPAQGQGRAPSAIAAVPAQAAHPTTVTLASGERAVGQLAPSDASTINLKSDGLGTLTLPWKNIATVEFGDAIVVTLADGRSVSGRATFTAPTTIVLKSEAGNTTIDVTTMTSVIWIDQPVTPPTFGDHWNISAGSQLHASRGNSGTTDFVGDFSITRQDDRNRLGFYGNRSLSNALSGDAYAATSDSAAGGVRVDRDITNRLAAFVSADAQHDRFQKVERLWVTMGVAAKIRTSTAASVAIPVGLSRAHDRQLTQVTGTGTARDGRELELSRAYNELQIGDSLRLHLRGTRAVLTQGLTAYVQVGSASVSVDAGAGRGVSSRRPITGNVRTEFSASVKLQLAGWLGWQAGVDDSYSRQPYQDVKTHDVTISSGFTFAIGRTDPNSYGGASSQVGRRVTSSDLPKR